MKYIYEKDLNDKHNGKQKKEQKLKEKINKLNGSK